MVATLLVGLCSRPALGDEAPPVADRAPLAELDRSYARCHNPACAGDLLDVSRLLVASRPHSYDAWWRLARAGFAAAHRAGTKKERREFGEEGYQAGLKAIEINPLGAEGFFWGASALGEHCRACNVVKVISQGLVGKLEAMFTRAVELDRTLDQGAPLMALGMYWTHLPWPLRDLGKAEGLLRQALEVAPDCRRNQARLADLLAQVDKDEEATALYRRCAVKVTGEASREDARWRGHCEGKLQELL